jgi:adenosine deaminase
LVVWEVYTLKIDEFIKGMPKVELHLHIEGTIDPGLLLEMARRNGIDLPYKNEEEVIAAQDYGEPALESFLAYHNNCQNCIQTEQDLHDVLLAFLARCNSENIRHAEMMFDPQTHMDKGMSFRQIVSGLYSGKLEGYKKYGVSCNLIMCAKRDCSEESALEMLEMAEPFREYITGVGLDNGPENGNPPSKFLEYYSMARKQGYHLSAHCDCDQEDSINHIAQCMDLVQVERIDHGVNVIDDNELVRNGLKKNICFTMCPTWRPSDEGPRRLTQLRKMFDLGLMVSINTDDPAEFASGYLSNTLIKVCEHTPYSRFEMVRFMMNAIHGSWMDETNKELLVEELNDYALDHDVIEEA